MDHRTHQLDSGEGIRTIGDDILVMPDPLPTESESGLIHFPGGAMEHTLGTGTILAYGVIKPKKKKGPGVPVPGLEVGLKCVFVRFVAEQNSNKQMRASYEGTIRLKRTDVLVVYTEDEHERILQ